MKKILVMADTTGWAFDKIYQGLKKNCKNYDVDVFYLHKPRVKEWNTYDKILYLCDNFPIPIIELVNRGLSKEKVILAVRSEVEHPLYEKKELLEQVCGTLAVSNEKLMKRFKDMHHKVRLAPGGIDTEVFTYKPRDLTNDPIRVGWSGNEQGWPKGFRGLDTIQKACDDLGMVFTPALRSEKWRTQEEMVDYYHNDIDIYVEMSKSAGRQNGLVEAAATGVPIISYNCGIAEQLIQDGMNGFILYERDVEQLKKALSKTVKNYGNLSTCIMKTVRDKWSWIYQSMVFESIFDEV